MWRLLIKGTDNTHPDPRIDQRGSWKRGYIVAVKPAGHVWGKEEVWPAFVRLDVSDLTEREEKRLQLGGNLLRKKYRVNLDNLPDAILRRIANNESPELTSAALFALVEDQQPMMADVFA